MSVLIFYHGDADGICSAAIAVRYLRLNNFDFVLREATYGEPVGVIPENISTVHILDFSFDPSTMKALTDKYSVVWVDHHITAIEKLQEFKNISGNRKDGTAACVLCWKHFFPDDDIPLCVQYIGDRDVWKFAFGDRTKYFHELFLFHEPKADDVLWEKWFDNEESFCLDFGNQLFESRIKKIKKHVDNSSWVFVHTLKDKYNIPHSVVGLKCNMTSNENISYAGDYIIKQGFDFAWLYYDFVLDGIPTRCNSLRSGKYNVGEFASAKGGGGHFSASGFYAPII